MSDYHFLTRFRSCHREMMDSLTCSRFAAVTFTQRAGMPWHGTQSTTCLLAVRYATLAHASLRITASRSGRSMGLSFPRRWQTPGLASCLRLLLQQCWLTVTKKQRSSLTDQISRFCTPLLSPLTECKAGCGWKMSLTVPPAGPCLLPQACGYSGARWCTTIWTSSCAAPRRRY